MRVEVVPVSIEDKAVLRNLMELYLYDFSEFEPMDVDDHGLFGYRYLDHYWTDDGRRPLLIRADGKLAGFVLLREREGAHVVSEFFVMRAYRRRGVGLATMDALFGRYSGSWSFEVLDSNAGALPFWRRVATRLQGVREDHIDDEQPRLRITGQALMRDEPQDHDEDQR
jgi:predicted acetyltransferase